MIEIPRDPGFLHISSQLQVPWFHLCNLKSAMVGVLTSQILTDATNQTPPTRQWSVYRYLKPWPGCGHPLHWPGPHQIESPGFAGQHCPSTQEKENLSKFNLTSVCKGYLLHLCWFRITPALQRIHHSLSIVPSRAMYSKLAIYAVQTEINLFEASPPSHPSRCWRTTPSCLWHSAGLTR